MKRNSKKPNLNERLEFARMATASLERMGYMWRMGWQYGDYRKIYKALGYPEERQLTYEYFYNKYERQDVATAIIDRPVEATWRGNLRVVSPDAFDTDRLSEAWNTLNDRLKVKQTLVRADKLAGIGYYALLLFGFSDVRDGDFSKPAGGRLTLLYVRPYPQDQVSIVTYETNPSSERYGLPMMYKIAMTSPGSDPNAKRTDEVLVHHSRVLHLTDARLTSEIEGRPRLKPIVNRLEDLEKLMGGDAEMFWRGARPGYHAQPESDAAFTTNEREQLEDELDKFEHDLRRFLVTENIKEIKGLDTQISDPASHVDIQLQAISAQTGIPKRILVGSERGELSSSQDENQWLTLIKTRQEEYAEIFILRPFVDRCMEHEILPKTKDYNVMWEDLFAPSDEDKVKVGEIRAKALKAYVDAVGGNEILPPKLVYKYLLGLNEEQVEEALQAAEEEVAEEEARQAEEDELERAVQEEVNRRMTQPPPVLPPGGGNGRPSTEQ